MQYGGLPCKQGLYDPKFEHDACGIGMIVNISGEKSHKLVLDAITLLQNMTHRGGVGSEPETGDGAGLLIQIPHDFMKRATLSEGIALPDEGEYAVAMLFASPDAPKCQATLKAFCSLMEREGLEVLGIRTVPVYPGSLGPTAATVCPSIRQVFVRKPCGLNEEEFERYLYIVSKLAAKEIRYAPNEPDLYFYQASFSCRTIVYKG
ncbi:MAG: glutamate synthase subunit alpha, partial [Syntrophomonadaceae bacterium]|nr:glutamate synthase subunit alpha [Syntrophomonadaceae bacterium]